MLDPHRLQSWATGDTDKISTEENPKCEVEILITLKNPYGSISLGNCVNSRNKRLKVVFV